MDRHSVRSPFGGLLGCRAKGAARAIESLVNAGLARPTDPGRRTRYELSPRGRDLGSAAFELRSGSKGQQQTLNVDDGDDGLRR